MIHYSLDYDIAKCPQWWSNFVHSMIPNALLQSAIEMAGLENHVASLLIKYSARFESNTYIDRQVLTFNNTAGHMLFMLEWS